MCTFCGALLYRHPTVVVPALDPMRLFANHDTNYRGMHCCGGGAVNIAPVVRVPARGEWFITYSCTLIARSLNNCLNITAIMFTNRHYVGRRGLPGQSSFRPGVCTVQGRLVHLLGPLFHGSGNPPRNAQLWIYNPHHASMESASTIRYNGIEFPSNVSQAVRDAVYEKLRSSEAIMGIANPYVTDFVTAGGLLRTGDVPNVQLVISRDARPAERHARQYNPVPGRRHTHDFQEICVLVGEHGNEGLPHVRVSAISAPCLANAPTLRRSNDTVNSGCHTPSKVTVAVSLPATIDAVTVTTSAFSRLTSILLAMCLALDQGLPLLTGRRCSQHHTGRFSHALLSHRMSHTPV